MRWQERKALRAEFEAWQKSNEMDVSRNQYGYLSFVIESRWEGFLAARAAHPAAVPGLGASEDERTAIEFFTLNPSAALIAFSRWLHPPAGATLATSDPEAHRQAIADFVADNWPDRKHSLAEIEAGIRAIEILVPAAPAVPQYTAEDLSSPDGWTDQRIADLLDKCVLAMLPPASAEEQKQYRITIRTMRRAWNRLRTLAAAPQPDEAAMYRWLRERLAGADFSEAGMRIYFKLPDCALVSNDLDKVIRYAMRMDP